MMVALQIMDSVRGRPIAMAVDPNAIVTVMPSSRYDDDYTEFQVTTGVLYVTTMPFCEFVATINAALADYEKSKGNSTATGYDLVAHIERQREWSGNTFGPGTRTDGIRDHVRKELEEIEAEPLNLEEWIDVVILALDGAWRAGHEPQAIAEALRDKQAKNESRQWPDWRTAPHDKAIEHVREDASKGEKT